MITKIKRKDVKDLVGDNFFDCPEYYVFDQAADKIRAIYVLFGWTHMLKDVHEIDDCVISLLSGCAQDLVDHPKQNSSIHSSAGVSVSLYLNEFDTMSIEIDFNILS